MIEPQTSQTIDVFDLSRFGAVPSSYQHHYRVVAPGAPLMTGGALLKWYDMTLEGWELPAGIDTQARALLLADPSFNGGLAGHGLGFVIAHYTTAGTFIIPGVWNNHNELWTSAYWRTHGIGKAFERVERGDLAPAFCVWELGTVCHERHAWHRYLFSAQDTEAKLAWLGDTMAGSV